MRYIAPALLVAAPLVAATASSKRGLCVVSTQTSQDDAIWTNDTDLTWYYNYGAVPTPDYANKLNFVPMLWGAPEDPANDMTFYNTVSNLIKEGQNITYVLGFNEPDGCSSGGSCVSAATAAQVWKKQMEPLKRDFGVKLGAPAVTGATTGFNWLANWFSECAALVASSGSNSTNNTSCEVDFIPAHWYGNFEGLASHLGQI
ncbi:glycoside hydrolase family 128 protein, partial [Aureobasidium melanogenum]